MVRRDQRRRLEALRKQVDQSDAVPLPPRRLQTAQDVIDLLQEQVDVVRRARWAGTIEKARAVAYLAGVARKAIEAGILADRLEMLERVLQQRAPDHQR